MQGCSQKMKTLTAADYDDAYLLPDHWIMHDRDSEGMFTRLHGYYVNRVVHIIQQSGASAVLEVGCGDGWACSQMAKAGLNVTGIDWSKNAVAYASIREPQATFICGDVRDLSIFPGRFDAIAFIEVIEHIPPEDCVAALRNIVQHLRDGGTFVLTTPSTNFINDNPQHYRHFTEAILRDIVGEVGGLEVETIEGYGDVRIEAAHWRKMRWVDNRYFQIKPLYAAFSRTFNEANTAGPTSLERCHGLIVTMRKT